MQTERYQMEGLNLKTGRLYLSGEIRMTGIAPLLPWLDGDNLTGNYVSKAAWTQSNGPFTSR
jgi:hypothetical protein